MPFWKNATPTSAVSHAGPDPLLPAINEQVANLATGHSAQDAEHIAGARDGRDRSCLG